MVAVLRPFSQKSFLLRFEIHYIVNFGEIYNIQYTIYDIMTFFKRMVFSIQSSIISGKLLEGCRTNRFMTLNAFQVTVLPGVPVYKEEKGNSIANGAALVTSGISQT
jgi:hypothetical protein